MIISKKGHLKERSFRKTVKKAQIKRFELFLFEKLLRNI
jgi:hypothetical protein